MQVRRRSPVGFPRIAAVAVLCSVCAGCSREERHSAPGALAFEETRSVASDALTVSLHLSSTRISVADRLTVLIEVRSVDGRWTEWPDELRSLSEGAAFGMAEPPSALAPWTVVAARRQRVTPGHEMLTLTLEPYLPGEKSIPAIRFGEGRNAVQTERLLVSVGSVVAPDAADAATPDSTRSRSRRSSVPGPCCRPFRSRCRSGAQAVGDRRRGRRGGIACARAWRKLAARRIMLRSATPASVFRRTMHEIRARAGASDADPGRAVEDTLAALRAYLISRRLLAPGATGSELADALRGCARVGLLGKDTEELVALLVSIESTRFGPGAGPSAKVAADLVNAVCRIAKSDDQSPSTSATSLEKGGAA